jgi:hypothetical protein
VTFPALRKRSRKRKSVANAAAAAAAAGGDAAAASEGSSPQDKYLDWLSTKYSSYLDTLMASIGSPSAFVDVDPDGTEPQADGTPVQACCLDAAMQCVKWEGVGVGSTFYGRVVSSLSASDKLSEPLLEFLSTNYLDAYADLRCATLRSLEKVLLDAAGGPSDASRDGGGKKKKAKGGGGGAAGKKAGGDVDEKAMHALSRNAIQLILRLSPLEYKKGKGKKGAGSSGDPYADNIGEEEEEDEEEDDRMDNPAVAALKALRNGGEDQKPALEMFCSSTPAAAAAGPGSASEGAGKKRKRSSSSAAGGVADAAGSSPASCGHRAQRKAYESCLLALLRLPSLPVDVYKKILINLPKSASSGGILPHLHRYDVDGLFAPQLFALN